MKHKFLLDENILHFAIKGINDQGQDDPAAGELIRLIGKNCHSIAMNGELWDRYQKHLHALLRVGKSGVATLLVINLLKNSYKLGWESSDPPEIPPEANIPRKDLPIVQLASLANALIVTTDKTLRERVNDYPPLQLKALGPVEAIPLASEQ